VLAPEHSRPKSREEILCKDCCATVTGPDTCALTRKCTGCGTDTTGILCPACASTKHACLFCGAQLDPVSPPDPNAPLVFVVDLDEASQQSTDPFKEQLVTLLLRLGQPSDAVEIISEPFPLMLVRCTKTIAEALETVPGVNYVICEDNIQLD